MPIEFKEGGSGYALGVEEELHIVDATTGELVPKIEEIMSRAQRHKGYVLTVDLERQTIEDSHGLSILFVVGEFQRFCLLKGLDDIGLTLQHEDAIRAYEASHG